MLAPGRARTGKIISIACVPPTVRKISSGDNWYGRSDERYFAIALFLFLEGQHIKKSTKNLSNCFCFLDYQIPSLFIPIVHKEWSSIISN